MANNVIKFDPRKRKQKRQPQEPPSTWRGRLTSRKALNALSIVLMVGVLGLASCWTSGSNGGPGTMLPRSAGTVSAPDDNGQVPGTALNQIIGTASVIDGDTIEIHGDRIRLDGYDAPERGSMCGQVNVYQKASLALSDLVGRRTVTCETSGKDRYGRFIATCEVGGQSLAEYMVSEGWARDWPKYSHGAYAYEERSARNARRGVWGLDCPADLWGDRDYN